MKEVWSQVLTKYGEFQGIGAQMGFFWLAWLLLFADKKYQKNPMISVLVKYTLGFLFIFAFPVTAHVIMKYCIGTSVYWRMLWLLPDVILLAYVLTRFVTDNVGIKRLFVFTACVALIALNGTGFYHYDKIYPDANAANLPSYTIEACNIIKETQNKYHDDEARVIVPTEMICSLRQYDATIKMPYGRAVLKGEQTHEIYTALQQQPLDCDTLAALAQKYDCNYFVYPVSEDGLMEGRIEQAGFEYVGQAEIYNIYRMKDEKTGDWIITSYPDSSGNQAMFYSLYNKKDDLLVLVDGGWEANEKQVRSVIRAYGGKVDAWFLTHYHTDHVSAFNQIYQNPKGITIEKIYASPYDYRYFEEQAKEWDNFDVFQKFCEITADAENLTYLKRDDSLQIGDLNIKVLNSFDELSVKNSKDIGNEGGLMLKISGKETSILLCADVHSEAMAKMLMKRYPEDLQADYVQCGHHGNNSFPTWFYDAVNPKTALFDAPEWLINSDDYTAKQLKQYFENKGVMTWDYTKGMKAFFFQ